MGLDQRDLDVLSRRLAHSSPADRSADSFRDVLRLLKQLDDEVNATRDDIRKLKEQLHAIIERLPE